MRLDPECVRDILLAVEEVCVPGFYFDSMDEDDMKHIKGDYSRDVIAYHARQCNENGFFIKYTVDLHWNWTVGDLSPAGHEFLSMIREDTNFNKAKEVVKKAGSFTIKTLVQAATSIVAAAITSNIPR